MPATFRSYRIGNIIVDKGTGSILFGYVYADSSDGSDHDTNHHSPEVMIPSLSPS
jgi:hypothetical protein